MEDLLQELIPHAPHLGLFVAPSLPEDKVRNACADYAPGVAVEDVVALYDATLFGNAKDGAVFLHDRFVFQNSDLEAAQEVRYADVVRVLSKRKLIGGQKVFVDVNRGRATVTLTMDFSGHPEAAGYVARFLHEAMLRGTPEERERVPEHTDVAAVRTALADLRRRGQLTREDYRRLIDVLEG